MDGCWELGARITLSQIFPNSLLPCSLHANSLSLSLRDLLSLHHCSFVFWVDNTYSIESIFMSFELVFQSVPELVHIPFSLISPPFVFLYHNSIPSFFPCCLLLVVSHEFPIPNFHGGNSVCSGLLLMGNLI